VEDDGPSTQVCVLCGKAFFGYGNNPDPLADDGVCCSLCNNKFVVPSRSNGGRAPTCH
jgi:DNA-directed RNA polymerase subunit RPC12/RpoP